MMANPNFLVILFALHEEGDMFEALAITSNFLIKFRIFNMLTTFGGNNQLLLSCNSKKDIFLLDDVFDPNSLISLLCNPSFGLPEPVLLIYRHEMQFLHLNFEPCIGSPKVCLET